MNMIKKAVEWYCIASSARDTADIGKTNAFERLNEISRH